MGGREIIIGAAVEVRYDERSGGLTVHHPGVRRVTGRQGLALAGLGAVFAAGGIGHFYLGA